MQGGARFDFSGDIGSADEQIGTTGDGLGRGHPELDANGAGVRSEGNDGGFFSGSGEKSSPSTRRRAAVFAGWIAFVAQHGVEREIGDVENGKHD